MASLRIPKEVVVILGAGGLGMAAARRLGSGKKLIIGTYSEDKLAFALKILKSHGFDAEGQLLDVSDFVSVRKLANDAAAHGQIKTIVHTSGVSPTGSTTKQVYDIDLLGTANVIDAFFEVASLGTSLICIASMAGHMARLSLEVESHLATAPREQLLQHEGIQPDAHQGMAYAMAKRANILRVQASALAWARRGARINSISPGLIMTPMGEKELASEAGDLIQKLVDIAGRAGTPEEIANVIAFLADPESSYVNGSDILVDGGAIAGYRQLQELVELKM